MKRLQHKQDTEGFSLVETLVAITILLVAIIGPMTIAARGLQTAFHSREQITALALAQEGVAVIREWRDDNALNNRDWLFGLDDLDGACSGGGPGCGFDVRDNFVGECSDDGGGNACRLNYDAGPLGGSGRRGFYTYDDCSNCSPSPFTRRVWIDPLSNGWEAVITVEVSWESGIFGGERSVTVQSRIFDHYDDI